MSGDKNRDPWSTTTFKEWGGEEWAEMIEMPPRKNWRKARSVKCPGSCVTICQKSRGMN